MRYVGSNGLVGKDYPTNAIGVRPAFYLDSDYYVTTSGNGSASNPYVGSAPDKIEGDYTIAEPEEDPNQEWDVSLDQQLRLALGPYYSSDGKYSTPTIPVYTIQKTRSDTENMVILICGEGYTKSQQQKFINDAKKYGKEQFSTSHIVVMPTASMCMRFVRHQSRALTIVVVHFLMQLQIKRLDR